MSKSCATCEWRGNCRILNDEGEPLKGFTCWVKDEGDVWLEDGEVQR